MDFVSSPTSPLSVKIQILFLGPSTETLLTFFVAGELISDFTRWAWVLGGCQIGDVLQPGRPWWGAEEPENKEPL